MNIKPATNVTAATVVTSLITMGLRVAQANGVVIPDEVMADAPALIFAAVAYIWDLATGANSAPEAAQKPAPAEAAPKA